jgi:copper chaperone CopZ
MIRAEFQIMGMHCPNCAMRLESLEDSIAGIHSALANYQQGSLVVEYDSALLGEAELLIAIREAGYEGVKTRDEVIN